MAIPFPPKPLNDRASNIVLWVSFALSLVGSGAFFLVGIHRGMSRDSGLAAISLFTRTALYVSIGVLLEALLMQARDGYLTLTKARRSVLHTFWIAVMLLSVGLIVDLLVFAFAGYHIPTALRILFADGPAGIPKVVDATGLSPKAVIASVVGLLLGIGIATVLSKVSRRLSATRANVVIPRRVALRAVFIAMGALSLVDMVALRVRNPFLWDREIRSVPLAFAVVRPAAELASFRVAVNRPKSAHARAAEIPVPRLENKPDIFIVFVESLRKDVVTPEVMPRFSAFAHDGWTFEHALTTGNVTHFSWYGLLCGKMPVFFEAAKASPDEHGSVPFALLRKAGYRIHLFATPDTGYQKLESVVFGDGGTLLDTKFHPGSPVIADRDDMVVKALAQRLAAEPQGGSVYVMALDSTHFGYTWGAGFKPPFTPHAGDISIARDYQIDEKARRLVINRYKSAVAWGDTLLGRFFDALASSRRLDNSIVVVTGDHGEAFWEHGSGTHGSDLASEQLEVGFAMRLPGRGSAHFDGVFSLMDVMPTVLAEIGIDERGALDGMAVQKRLPAGWARHDGPTESKGVLAPRAALSFQGWNERAFRFAVTQERRRMLFELDDVDPLRAHRLVLKDIRDLHDVPLIDQEGHDLDDAYQSIVRELPAILDAIPFVKP